MASIRVQVIREIKAGKLDKPSVQELEEWMSEGGCIAACTCQAWVEPDGYCQHGRPSWLILLGYI